ncbi:LysM peptidoglycan-binding domain-containing protein [Limosilactobacillus antri]|uniref:LysM domain protein n=1 Tax=Limosilactobacillus antri DSM 16041 TaxID=525309 RepID=C8P443_9LACO|nr:LysM domain-containing protein [Limosilactobacillus antri]EEW54710.1 LysM domain protein [Limosilactobacillus antri DSM 16041]KRK60640.1 hypothetical protein FC31_GL000665 [Limosilactobacillus antri DSM 16041]
MKINNKKRLAAVLMTAVLAGPVMAPSVVLADNATGSPAEQADITNWIANTPQQVSNNMAMQHIDMNNLNGTRYIIQWGDTLSSISAATGISIAKLCYDNNIQNANLIYAGDVLILNRNGDVPAGYKPNVNPNAVAQTRVTINNGPKTVNIYAPKSVKKIYNEQVDNSKTDDHSSNTFAAPAAAKESSADTNSDSQSSQESSSSASVQTKTKSAAASHGHKRHSALLSAADIVSGLESVAGDSKLSFEEGNGGDDADSLDVDSAAILKAAKKGNYDDVLSEIEDALNGKDKDGTTIYIEKDGNELHVYASHQDESSSKDSNKDDSDSSQQSDDDSNNQATNDSQDTDTTDDDD